MFTPAVHGILKESLKDTLPLMAVESGCLNHLPEYLSLRPEIKSILLVCDENTWKAAGEQAESALSSAHYRIETLLLDPSPSPSMHYVHTLIENAKNADALLAVGSGAINDLCKLAAHRLNKPYAVAATAASMNGYASANASIIENGARSSHAARLPFLVLCDLEIICAAPIRLMRAGLGDSLARPTAQADWLLSHHLLETAYDERPFALLAPYEPELLDAAPALTRRDRHAMSLLMRVLLLSGLGMAIAGGSYPASQGEHMIAHCYEMAFPHRAHSVFHGEQIGVTSLSMAELQRKMISKQISHFSSGDYLKQLNTLFNADTAEEVKPLYEAKHYKIKEMEKEPHLLADRWNAARQAIRAVMVKPAVIEAALRAVGAPVSPQDLGWPEEEYRQAMRHARFTRDRFTFLDLIAE